jgi:6-phosphogluconolactonase
VKTSHVYVSSAEDGDIGRYMLRADGTLEPAGRVSLGRPVMPLAVRPDKRYLVAAVRAEPYAACSYRIDAHTGALELVGSGPLAASMPYIRFDKTGRFLLSASYGAHLVSVNPVDSDGRVGASLQVLPTARHAHAIITDHTNRFVFVPHLGTDQVFQFLFDEDTGRLMPNTPPFVQLAAGCGPRHLVTSPDNRFVYVLNELTASVTTFALDASTGLLSEVGSASALPPDTNLVPGAPRPSPGRNVDDDIWASDIHVTPNGRFLYAAERTSSSIGVLRVDSTTGRLTYLCSTPTEKQPRGFAIDPGGRFLIVCGEKSDTLSSYAIEPASGALELIGKYPTGKGSNWVEIVALE